MNTPVLRSVIIVFSVKTSQPTLAKPAPTMPPISACDDDDGRPSHAVSTFQKMAPIKPAKTRPMEMNSGDDDLGDGVGHLERQEEERDEVEERGPHHRLPRLQHSRRDHGGDGVRRVVKAVDEVEDQRDADDGDDHQVGHIRRASPRLTALRRWRPRPRRWRSRSTRRRPSSAGCRARRDGR